MTLMLALLLSTQEQQQQQQQTQLPAAAGLISNVMSHYASANSLTATIASEVKSGQTVISFSTALQYDKPNLLMIQQSKSATGPVDRDNPNKFRTALFVTDGQQMGYDDPDPAKRLKGKRGFEPTRFLDGKSYSMPMLYGVAKGSLLQESIPLDLLMADRDSLQQVKNRLETFKTVDTTKMGEKTAYVIEGKMTDYPIKGDFQMVVDQEGNLYNFAISAYVVGVTDTGGQVEAPLLMNYKINAQINPTTDKAKYKVR